MEWFKKHKILTVILVLIILGIAGGASGGSKSGSTNTSTAGTPSPSAAAQVAKIGEAANDGKFAFTVSSIQCGKTTVGSSQYLTKTAQGQFCLLSVSVKNVGDQAQSLFSANQKLLNAQNQEYAADDTATMYQAPSGTSWYSSINPGNSVSGQIVFDIPKDQTPVKAELHDSTFSNEIVINLQ